MKLFKKKDEKEKVISVDENGNPIQKEKGKGKQVVKKVVFALGAAAVGIATFVAVGLALGATADSEENLNWVGDGSNTGTTEDCSESSDGETSGEE